MSCRHLNKLFPQLALVLGSNILGNAANAAEAAGQANSASIATFICFLVLTLFITSWAARRNKTKEDFYLAGGQITGVQNGFAIAGDTMSAASFLGLVGLMFVVGFDTLFFIISLVVSWLVVVLIVAERLRNLGSYTFADAISYRLSRKPVRIMAATCALTIMIPYLLAQMVAAGGLVESLFGLSYTHGVIVVGVLMTIYVTFGGMMATTWVQIVKAVLLIAGGSMLAIGVLNNFDFSITALINKAVEVHPAGEKLLQPGGLYTDIISTLSLSLAFIGGTAAMPHVLMRFFTVPDAAQARKSAVIALSLIAYFQIVVIIVGLGAVVFLLDNADYSLGGTDIVGGSNMAAIHLAQIIGGDVFMGFISAVAFATILAVVSGITLSAGATISHDLYSNVISKEKCTETQELWISRVTVVVLGAVGIFLAIIFEGQNVAVLATLPLAIGASTNFPLLLLSMYWGGITTRGTLAGGYAGLLSAVALLLLGPNVWVPVFGFDTAIFPYAYPTLFSMSICFGFAWWFSITDKSSRADEERSVFEAQLLRSQLGDDI
ncbi:MAG: cation/acetate symporter [Halioglobus sp.]|jgi:cation/acetate symporter